MLSVTTFSNIPELIIVKSCMYPKELDLTKEPNEIIVDTACGSAVLRGSHIYAPGVLGMPRGLNIGDSVSVYVDLKQACKRGLVKLYDDESKLFIGNGIVKMMREQIFCHDNSSCSGIAIIMTDTISCIPQLNEKILPKGHLLLQNLPSIICSRILDPQPGEIILDMCAAPGNKTTHIAALMNNKGIVIALEKIKNKLEKLNSNIESFFATNVKTFCYDSTKVVCESKDTCISNGPPFAAESFDRILLDGPCSALGQRPQLRNSISVYQLRSYVPLQRKLFSMAFELLKPGGTLVYSTCTITVAENEGIIAWALKAFPKLELQCVREKLTSLNVGVFGTMGYNIDGLTVEQSKNLWRLGCESDFVGFFIACFIKR
ncbi:tRNA (cytosine(72)-C(5))-methyltransferase NSUN6 isoform X2 [Phymastichus coffea]|nr:tRNA (cytosine(72)-C(5))-methyltransferase NSUN6 isoform X2 [Phymastichus coffea]XP_058805331.1 tRNA (cytosine(72)-C(5))-methyltransferase NSUN6 isoform X2 [Phymastichus coffea]